jgi:hypothetical protein
MVPHRPDYTPQHKSKCNDSYTQTLTPSLATHRGTNFLVIGTAKTLVPKRLQKCGNTEVTYNARGLPRPRNDSNHHENTWTSHAEEGGHMEEATSLGIFG